MYNCIPPKGGGYSLYSLPDIQYGLHTVYTVYTVSPKTELKLTKPQKLYNVGGLSNCPICRFALAAYILAADARARNKASNAMAYHLREVHHLAAADAEQVLLTMQEGTHV